MKVKILVKNQNNLVLPAQGNPNDAGYDIVATSEPNIVGVKINLPVDGVVGWSKIDYIEYKTNLFICPKDVGTKKFHTLIYPRSSISKKNLMLANGIGLIDSDYRGEILLRFNYLFQPEDLRIVPEYGVNRFIGLLKPESVYAKGDKIAQLKGDANIALEFVKVESFDDTVRGSGGFGSTG